MYMRELVKKVHQWNQNHIFLFIVLSPTKCLILKILPFDQDVMLT